MSTNFTAADWDVWLQALISKNVKLPIDPQALRGMVAVLRWLECVGQEQGPVMLKLLCEHPEQMRSQIEHSALMRRLLEGKEPLAHAPPLSYSRPWYDLVDTGEGAASEVKVSSRKDGALELLINHSPWQVLKQVGPEEWLATYRVGGEPFKVWHDPTIDPLCPWRLKKAT